MSPPPAPRATANEVGGELWSVRLTQELRQAGVRVGTGQVIACQQGLDELDGTQRADRYWVARTCLLSDPADVATFDEIFARFDARWAAGGSGEPPLIPVPAPPTPVSGVDTATDQPGERAAGPDEVIVAGAVASERERLRTRRFEAITDDERASIEKLLERLQVAVPRRTSRRTTPGRRGELDLARTLERAVTTDGELLDRAWRVRKRKPRRVVVLLDVSGSMAGYARILLRFALAARRTADRQAGHHVEVFAFGTRLTRLSDALALRDVDAAIAAAAAEVLDWDGGTRIGGCVDELVRIWGRRGVLRGSVVVVCSDGLERGDPHQLGASMARLRRHVHRVVWVNPLAGDPRYLPTQRGMAAALPHVDILLAGDTLASLESLSEVLARLR